MDTNIKVPDLASTGDFIVGARTPEGQVYSDNGAMLDGGGNRAVVGGSDLAKLYAQDMASRGTPIQNTLKTQPKKRGRPFKNKPTSGYIQVLNPNTANHTPPVLTVTSPQLGQPAYYAPVVAPKDTSIDVVFTNQFGKIKLSAEHVLIENNFVCLVFKSEDEMRFVPATGEVLKLSIPEKETIDVYFPNAVFTWPDGIKKLMVLAIKYDESSQSTESGESE